MSGIVAPGGRLAALTRAGVAVLAALVALSLFPSAYDTAGPIKWLVVSWGVAFLAAFWLVGSWLKDIPLQPVRIFPIPLGLFLALLAIAAFMSSHRAHSFVHLRRFMELGLLCYITAQVYRTPRQARLLAMFIAGATALSALYALLLQRTGHDPIPWSWLSVSGSGEAPGTFGNPNFAAHAMMIAILLALWLAATPGRRWLGLLLAVPLLAHLWTTGCRSAWIALAAAVLLIVIGLMARRMIKGATAGGLTTLAVMAVIAMAVSGGIMLRFNGANPAPLGESILARYNGYVGAAAMVRERPLLGYGPGNYLIENPKFWTTYEQEQFARTHKMNDHVHNEPLEIAVDGGLLALAAWALVIGFALAAAFRLAFNGSDDDERRMGWLVAAVVTAVTVDGLFGFPLRTPASAAFFFLLLGVLDGVVSGERDESTAAAMAGMNGIIGRWALVAIAFFCAWPDSQVFAAGLLRGGAMMAYRSGHLEAADKTLSRAMEYAPWDWTLASDRAEIHAAAGYIDGADLNYRGALALNPQDFQALVNLANLKSRSGLTFGPPGQQATDAQVQALQDATMYAKYAVSLCGALAEAWEVLGRTSFGIANRLHAESAYRPIDPAKLAGLWREAADQLNRATLPGRRAPRDIRKLLALALKASGDLDEAEQAFCLAVRDEPGSDSIWQDFMAFARETNHIAVFEEALEAALYEASVAAQPDRPVLASIHLARAHLATELRGNNDMALLSFTRALENAPQRIDIWRAYAAFTRPDDGAAQARTAFLEATSTSAPGEKAPSRSIEALRLAFTGGETGLLEATDSLRAVMDIRTTSATAVTDMDEVRQAAYWLTDEFADAPAESPAAAHARLNLGLLMADAMEMPLAESLLSGVFDKLGAADQVKCGMGWSQALLLQGKSMDALAIMERTAAIDPDDIQAQLVLARLQSANGRKDDAEATYKTIENAPIITDALKNLAASERAALSVKSKGLIMDGMTEEVKP